MPKLFAGFVLPYLVGQAILIAFGILLYKRKGTLYSGIKGWFDAVNIKTKPLIF